MNGVNEKREDCDLGKKFRNQCWVGMAYLVNIVGFRPHIKIRCGPCLPYYTLFFWLSNIVRKLFDDGAEFLPLVEMTEGKPHTLPSLT